MKNLFKYKFFQNCLPFLHKRLKLILIFLFCLGIGVAFAGFYQLSESLIEAQALQTAQMSSIILNKSIRYYSENVVQRVKSLPDAQVTSDYKNIEGAIPIPVTFTIELGEFFSQENNNTNFRLYSNYPFPKRRDTGGSRDKFEEDAIAFLEQNPDRVFYRKEQNEDNWIFRYAEPVVMESSCVQCHNSLPNSPKKDWKVGDVRGVLSISQPLDTTILVAKQGLSKIIITLCSIIGLAFLGILFIFNRLNYINEELDRKVRQQTAELQYLTTVDSLTKLYNRRHFDTFIEQEWNRLKRLQQPLTLIMIDVDYFKKYNDTYGHQAGDRCLIEVAREIKQLTKRAGEFAARYGGEEFVIVLPNTDINHGFVLAEKLQDNISRANLIHESSLVAKQITLSMGITSIIPQNNIPLYQLIEWADRALFEAKDKGRNCYVARYSN